MTEVEALALKPGDRVEVRVGKQWRCAEVISVVKQEHRPDHLHLLKLNQHGFASNGSRLCRLYRKRFELRGVRLPGTSEPALTANVFADWLWENGFEEASDALRRRFPLAIGAGD